MEMYRNILDKPLRFPMGYFSDEAVDLCQKLLVKKPEERLGYGPSDADGIKNHPFFDGIDWAAMKEKMVTPPYIPSDDQMQLFEFFDSSLIQSWEVEADETMEAIYTSKEDETKFKEPIHSKTAGHNSV